MNTRIHLFVKVLYIIISITLLGARAYAQNSKVEDTIYSIIEKIPEVNKYCRRLDSISNSGHCRIEILSKPNMSQNYYWVQIGPDRADRFVPIYNFYVEYPSLMVKYYDAADNSIMTLSEWRKTKNKH